MIKYFICGNCDKETIIPENLWNYSCIPEKPRCIHCGSPNMSKKEIVPQDCSSPYKINMVSKHGDNISKCTPEFREKLKSLKKYYKGSTIDC